MKTIITVTILFLSLLNHQGFAMNKTKKRDVASSVQVVIEDVVYKILPTDDGFKILFSQHSGVYYLLNSSKHFDSLHTALKNSMDKDEAIKVKADATSLNINELVLSAK